MLLQHCDEVVSAFCFCIGYTSCSTTTSGGSVTLMGSNGAAHVGMQIAHSGVLYATFSVGEHARSFHSL